MRLIDKHILKAWSKAFLLAMGATVGVLLLENMYSELPRMLREGADAYSIGLYYLLLVPTFFPVVVPVGLLISLMLSLGGLHQNNEITAMRAAGLSTGNICRSLWFMGVMIAGGLLYLNAYFIPYAVEETREMRQSFKLGEKGEGKFAQGVRYVTGLGYKSAKQNKLWYIDRVDVVDWTVTGVSIYSRDKEGNEISRIFAQKGQYDFEKSIWEFSDGYELIFDVLGEPERVLTYTNRKFEELKDSPVIMVNMSKLPKNLSLGELREILNSSSGEESPSLRAYYIRYQRILASSLTCLIVIGLAIPIATSGVRINPMVRASKVILIFFAYFLIASLTGALGSQGFLSPIMGAWMPQIVAIIFTVFLYRRVQ